MKNGVNEAEGYLESYGSVLLLKSNYRQIRKVISTLFGLQYSFLFLTEYLDVYLNI